MSLVNDMLRDLDARRRDAPARGIGAEKLVPASEQPTASGARKKPVWLWLALPLLLSVVIVAYLLLSRDSGQLPAVVLSQPVAPVATTNPAPANDRVALNEAVGTELAEMSARMRELEAQNEALMRAQQSASGSPLATGQAGGGGSEQGAWQPRDWTPQADADSAAVAANQAEAAQAPVTEPADVVQSTPVGGNVNATRGSESPVVEQPGPAAESPGATTRSPREMSFAETDRLRVQQALQQWNGGQQLAALQALDGFTYEFPEAHQSREMLAKLLIQQGEPERAMQVVDLGLTIAPRRGGYRKVKARLLLNQGLAAEAVTILSDNRPSVQDDVEYHDLLATGLLSSAMYDEAAVTYRSLLETDEGPGRWWYGLAASLDAQGRAQNAAQAYEQALRREDLSAALRQGSQQRLQAIRQILP